VLIPCFPCIFKVFTLENSPKLPSFSFFVSFIISVFISLTLSSNVASSSSSSFSSFSSSSSYSSITADGVSSTQNSTSTYPGNTPSSNSDLSLYSDYTILTNADKEKRRRRMIALSRNKNIENRLLKSFGLNFLYFFLMFIITLNCKLAPNIYGHEDIKKGILCQLFGGSNRPVFFFFSPFSCTTFWYVYYINFRKLIVLMK
jgi:hypothetical protein